MATTPTMLARPRARGSRCCDVTAGTELVGEAAERLAAELQALAHPIRLQLLDILARRGGEVCVCDLESAVPVKQPTVSHHLRLLREGGLVDTIRRGLWAYYLVRPEALAALRARIDRLLATQPAQIVPALPTAPGESQTPTAPPLPVRPAPRPGRRKDVATR